MDPGGPGERTPVFAVIYLPDFALQAALRGGADDWSAPVALVDASRIPARVCAVTPAARAAGVEAGLTATQAQSRCGAVQIRQRSVEVERLAAEAVAQAAFAFSPSVEATAEDLWTLDLRALAALKGATGETIRRWAQQLQGALLSLGWRAKIGLGATPNLARHAARWVAEKFPMTGDADNGGAAHGIEVVEDATAWVASLPISVLAPSSAVAPVLAAWGIRTVGELLRLGLAALADRLGLEALALFAAADVTSLRPLRLMKPVERFAEAHEFAEPVTTLEPVLFLVRRFIDQLTRRLEPSGRVVGEMRLQLRLESGDVLGRELCVPDPTRNADLLFRMWHTQLESVRTDAPVTGVSLTVQPERAVTRQFSLFQTVLRDPGQLQVTLGRLEALLGPDRVGTPVRTPGHQRDAFRLVPPDFESPLAQETSRPVLLQPVPWRRLRPAPVAQVETENVATPARPMAVRCAVVTGRLKITLGPWRSSGQWWDAGAWSREDWEVETMQGVTLRLSHGATEWRTSDVLD